MTPIPALVTADLQAIRELVDELYIGDAAPGTSAA